MTLEKIYEVLEHTATFSVLIPVVILLFRIKALNTQLWALLFYLVTCIVVDRMSLLMLPDESKVNMLFNTFTIFEVLFFLFLYYKETYSLNIKILFCIVAGLFVIASIIFFQNNFDKSSSLIATIESALLVIISSLYSLHIVFESETAKKINPYFFWINLGVIIYFSGSFLLFMNEGFIESCSLGIAILIWSVHAIVGILSNMFFSIGIWNKKIESQL